MAVPTKAYNLGAKTIIHAVVPKWIDGNHNEYDLLSSAYLTSLKVADCMECTSIAFPLLASGNNGYDPELAFQIAKESISSFEGNYIQKVMLVIYGNRIASIVERQGYTVDVIPEKLLRDVLSPENENQNNGLIEDGKEVAIRLLEESMQRAVDYLKNEANRKQLIDWSAEIVKNVFSQQKNNEEEPSQKGKKTNAGEKEKK